jgi:hypothetical protein
MQGRETRMLNFGTMHSSEALKKVPKFNRKIHRADFCLLVGGGKKIDKLPSQLDVLV